MALVGYSDSESSDSEDAKTVPAVESKKFDRTASKKIKVDLSALTNQAESSNQDEPATKRPRTAGAFSGFNSLLPAPKRTVQSAGKKSISLKTSSEAAFSREPVQQNQPRTTSNDTTSNEVTATQDIQANESQAAEAPSEVKIVGKATRFVPLSVANAKKKKPLASTRPVTQPLPKPPTQEDDKESEAPRSTTTLVAEPKSRPRRSLFAVSPAEQSITFIPSGQYEPEFTEPAKPHETMTDEPIHALAPTNAAGLQAIATDLNLSASERRRLFGRGAKQGDLKIAHFDMDAEYRSNQEIAAKGELFEHRAVKAIAPGKHSLQQLVNNVRGQTDAIEDKWAEGRRNRNEAGNRYGW